jgi:two-component system, cell cycle sensor histidine kinase and response regulator CckA
MVHDNENPAVVSFSAPATPDGHAAGETEVREAAAAWYRTTLYSIGDAVISTDAAGLVRQMNPVAEQLTGWREADAMGRPLNEVFRIINEQTRQPVEDPVAKVLRERTVIGLANHTLLVAKDGREYPIADSGAPIRDAGGRIMGVVLVFRDQTREREYEHRLLELTERLEATLDALPDILFEIDREGRIRSCRTPSTSELYLPPEAFLGQTFRDVLPPATWDSIGAAVDEAYATGRHRGATYALDMSDGEHWYELSATRRGAADNPASHVMVLVRDITARKQAEIAQRESQRMLQLVLDSIPVGVYWKDRESRYLGCNRRFVDDAGIADASVLIGHLDAEFSPADLAAHYVADDERVMSGRERLQGMEQERATQEGERVPLRVSKVPLQDASGDVVGVLGIYEDITAERAVMRELQRAVTSLDEAMRVAKMGSWVFDLASGVFTFDDNLFALLKTSATAWGSHQITAEQYMRQFVPPEAIPGVEDAIRQAIETTDPRFEYQADSQVICADGEVRDLSVWFTVEKDADGRTVRTHGVNQDVTERKRAEADREHLQAQLQQSQKMESIGRLAGGVAHDFNNMLQAIIGNVELAIEDAPDSIRGQLQEVHGVARRSAELTKQLLAFARRQTVARRTVNLNDSVADALKMLRRLVGEGLQVRWEPCADVWSIRIDPAQVHQILANLVVNARDAITGTGFIAMSTLNVSLDAAFCATYPWAQPGDYVRLTVQDSGCGMSQDVMAHLFEPFFTTKELGKGTGLGLATVYGIVKQNDGAITVDSAPGGGTTVSLYLPRVQEVSAETSPETRAPSAAGTETVLVVEDEDVILSLVRTVLERRGYTVLAAASPGEALAHVRGHDGPIHLLIADMGLPEMPGAELAEMAVSLRPGLRALFMSGHADPGRPPDDAEAPGRQGQFIEKPFAASDLAAKVREVLDRHERPHEVSAEGTA